MHVNVYTYSQIKNLKIAPVQAGKAAGFVIECVTNRGPATRTETHMLSEMAEETNKNHAEMLIMAEAMAHVKAGVDVTIFTDNVFIGTQFREGHVQQWKGNGWNNASGKPVTNQKAWEKLLNSLEGRQVEWRLAMDHEYKSWLKAEVEERREYLCSISSGK